MIAAATGPDPAVADWISEFLQKRTEIDAVVAAVADAERILCWAGGRRGPGTGGPDLDTLFDLASLTKPFTATLALELDRRGEMALTALVREIWPSAATGLGGRSLEDLLRHRAGLAPWAPLGRLGVDRGEIDRELVRDPRWHGAEQGTYSDLGPILWLRAAERRTGRSGSELLTSRVLSPGGWDRSVLPAPVEPADAEPCRLDGTREQTLAADLGIGLERAAPPAPGEAQDGNVRWLGGFSGHAGLFGSARGAALLGQRWLRGAGLPGADQRARALGGGGSRALGWARRTPGNSGGEALSEDAYGHVGFTGGSLWVDPRSGRAFVLLAHRSEARPGLEGWRRAFHRRFAPREPAAPGPA